MTDGVENSKRILHEATLKAAKAFGMTVIDIFSDPSLVRKIKEEFEQAKPKRRPD